MHSASGQWAFLRCICCCDSKPGSVMTKSKVMLVDFAAS